VKSRTQQLLLLFVLLLVVLDQLAAAARTQSASTGESGDDAPAAAGGRNLSEKLRASRRDKNRNRDGAGRKEKLVLDAKGGIDEGEQEEEEYECAALGERCEQHHRRCCASDPFMLCTFMPQKGYSECDFDSDGDGVLDSADKCPKDPSKSSSEGFCGCGNEDSPPIVGFLTQECVDEARAAGNAYCDIDRDQIPDCDDICPLDPNNGGSQRYSAVLGVDNTSPLPIVHQITCNYLEGYYPGESPGTCDSNGDGIADCSCPDIDSDNDGTIDCADVCPFDETKIKNVGFCGCGVPDEDLDSDGTLDCEDSCPLDPMKILPGSCGCGVVDTPGCTGAGTFDNCPHSDKLTNTADLDGDSIPDCSDFCWGAEPDAESCPRTFNIQLEKVTEGESMLDFLIHRVVRAWESILCEEVDSEPLLLDPADYFLYDDIEFKGSIHAVDDLLIGYGYFDLGPCNASGCLAANAGPTLVNTISDRARVGVIRVNLNAIPALTDFFGDDFELLCRSLYDTIFHEVGHVLSIIPNGPKTCPGSCVVGGGNVDYDRCTPSTSFAQAAYEAYTGSSFPRLQLEGNTNSDGTDCSHWASGLLGKEIMVGNRRISELQEISSITAGAMLDVGYAPSKREDPSQIGCLMPWSGPSVRCAQYAEKDIIMTLERAPDIPRVERPGAIQGRIIQEGELLQL
jgi:hypothetical protein